MDAQLNFNDYGLAIGFISYSFKTDGKELYRTVFKKGLFDAHRKNLIKYTNEKEVNATPLYEPAGYRLFGDHGLAVLSLIDDYAFCNRIFNNNHTHNSDETRWGAKIVTGISDERKDYLHHKALQTFLRPKEAKRYPYIGITKLKIDHRLLRGRGLWYTKLIKQAIDERSSEFTKVRRFDYFVVDCFDNDEMAIVAFSDSLTRIHSFMANVRNLDHKAVEALAPADQLDELKYTDATGKEKEKHVFVSCYSHLGYDVGYRAGGKNPTFLPVNKNEQSEKAHRLILICEAKPGHRAELETRINDKINGPCVSMRKSLTGGAKLQIYLPVRMIGQVEDLCKNPDFSNHVRNVKVALRSSADYVDAKSDITSSHEMEPEDNKPFSTDYVKNIKDMLDKCGVPKIARERLLNLYCLYNDSVDNPLHSAYFTELREPLEEFKTILEEFIDDASKPIKELLDHLSKTVALFEEAFYNRFCDKGFTHNNLDYNGGVQQYLTCFDFVYKQLLGLPLQLRSELPERVFASISEHERVSSTRLNLRLNINQITYPELFATTVWKEAINHSKPLELKTLEEPIFRTWDDFLSNEESFKTICFFLDKDTWATRGDDIFAIIRKRMDRKLLKYLVADQIVFHFGFNRDFGLFWNFYWKTVLQTSVVYSRTGEMRKDIFVDTLLRLLVVREKDYRQRKEAGETMADYNKLIDSLCHPYDSVVADLWLSCYDKIEQAAKSILRTIDVYGFSAVSEKQILLMENQLEKKYDIGEETRGYTADKKLAARKRRIGESQRPFRDFEFQLQPIAQTQKFATPEYLICLMVAFLREMMALDFRGKGEKAIIRVVPRDKKGQKCDFIKRESASMVNMPADPFGGVLIPDMDIRKRYFAARSVFYRVLWHYKLMAER